MVDISPKLLLEGESPRLIDEWQLAPKLWDAIRFESESSLKGCHPDVKHEIFCGPIHRHCHTRAWTE